MDMFDEVCAAIDAAIAEGRSALDPRVQAELLARIDAEPEILVHYGPESRPYR